MASSSKRHTWIEPSQPPSGSWSLTAALQAKPDQKPTKVDDECSGLTDLLSKTALRCSAMLVSNHHASYKETVAIEQHCLNADPRMSFSDADSQQDSDSSPRGSDPCTRRASDSTRRASDSQLASPETFERSNTSIRLRSARSALPATQPPSLHDSSSSESSDGDEYEDDHNVDRRYFQFQSDSAGFKVPQRVCTSGLGRAHRQPEANSNESQYFLSNRSSVENGLVVDQSCLTNSMSVPTSKTSAAGLSGLEALVAACELAAEKEGMDDNSNYYQELVAESPGFAREAAGSQDLSTAVPLLPSIAIHADFTRSSPKTTTNGDVAATTHANSLKLRTHSIREDTRADTAHAPLTAFLAGTASDSAHRYRRHKSKVFIRPNKVVYLPTTFMEEAFDPSLLPMECELTVEADGELVTGEKHLVTIKAVPRQGLSTMYCMTNVMKFQQTYLNWQILNWTKIDDYHIKIHLQGPGNGSSNSCAAPVNGKAAGKHCASHRAGSSTCDESGACVGTHTPRQATDTWRRQSGHSGDVGDDDLEGITGDVEVVRRSSRSVRVTALMQEHLEQERLAQLTHTQTQRHVTRPDLSSLSMPAVGASGPLSPTAPGSNKRRGDFASELMIDTLHVANPESEGAFTNGKLRQQDAAAHVNPLMLFAFAGFGGAHPAPSNAHTPQILAGMEGSAMANLYFMPQPQANMDPQPQSQVLDRATPRASTGPHCVGTTDVRHAGGASRAFNGVAAATDDSAATPVDPGCFPRLPGALALLGCGAQTSMMQHLADQLHVDNARCVGMLGPSIPLRPPSPGHAVVAPLPPPPPPIVARRDVRMDIDAARGLASTAGDSWSASQFASGSFSPRSGAFKRVKSDTVAANCWNDLPTPSATPLATLPVPPVRRELAVPPPVGHVQDADACSVLPCFPSSFPGSYLNTPVSASQPVMLGGSPLGASPTTTTAMSTMPEHSIAPLRTQRSANPFAAQHVLGIIARNFAPLCAATPVTATLAPTTSAAQQQQQQQQLTLAPHIPLTPGASLYCGARTASLQS